MICDVGALRVKSRQHHVVPALRLTRSAPCVSRCQQFVNLNMADLLLFVGCLTSQQQASVSQRRICSDNFTCCHTETKVAHPTFHLTQSQYTDTGPTSPSTDPLSPGDWQGIHWSASFEVTDMTRPGKIPSQAEFEHRIFLSRGGRLNH